MSHSPPIASHAEDRGRDGMDRAVRKHLAKSEPARQAEQRPVGRVEGALHACQEFAAGVEEYVEPLKQAARLPHTDRRRAKMLYDLDLEDAVRMARRERAGIVCAIGRSRVRPAPRPRQARPRSRRRVGASSRTSGTDPGEPSESPKPPELRLWRHPRYGLCSPNLLRVLGAVR